MAAIPGTNLIEVTNNPEVAKNRAIATALYLENLVNGAEPVRQGRISASC
jgi:hypothetical protein